jgi:hypothetical protein
MEKKKPKYKLVLDEDTDDKSGLTTMSLVNDPAIQQGFIAFSNDEEIKFSVSEDRHIITGPAMIPDMEIERARPFPRTITISKEMIESTVKKFNKTGRTGNVNLEHAPMLIDGIYPFESFVSDSSRGILAPQAFSHLPDGTWYVSYYVESPELWNDIKSGKYNGFSIQGFYKELELAFSASEAPSDDWEFIVNLL